MIIVETIADVPNRITGPFPTYSDAYAWIDRVAKNDLRYKWSVVRELGDPDEVEAQSVEFAARVAAITAKNGNK